LGTGKDGNPKTVAIAVGKTLTPEQVQKGLEYVLLRKDLELFAPGKELRVRVQVDFYPNEVADTKKTFTLARYTLVTAGMKATLEFLNAPYRVAPMGRLTDILLKLVDENGEFIKEKLLSIIFPLNFKYADGTSGKLEVKTDLFGRVFIRGVRAPDAPGTTYIIKAEYDGNVVTAKLDVTSRGKVDELSTGFGSGSIALSPDGTKLFLGSSSTHGENGLVVIDTESFQVLKTVTKLGEYFTVGPDSNQVFTSSYSAVAGVGVLNVTNGEIVKIYVQQRNWGRCIWSFDAANVYVSTGARELWKIDTILKRGKIIAEGEICHGARFLLSPDGRRLFIYGGFNDFKIVSIATDSEKIIATSAIIQRVIGLAISSDGKYIYLSSPSVYGPQIVILDSTSLSVVRSVDVVAPGVIAVSPDGRLLCYGSEGNKVRVLDSKSYQEVKAFAVADEPFDLKFSPDGSRVYIAHKYRALITVLQVE
jgi:DNA-binding beta-propeller fold protein YncE